VAESLLTPKCTIVPVHFFDPAKAQESLQRVVELDSQDQVKYVDVPQYDAVLVYSNKDIISGSESELLPEMFYLLEVLPSCKEYNKIVASWVGGYLYLAIAQGKSLLLANSYQAKDFTTAQYFIFLAMKSLQLNPEISTISWRLPIGPEEEMSLYRYFKTVEQL